MQTTKGNKQASKSHQSRVIIIGTLRSLGLSSFFKEKTCTLMPCLAEVYLWVFKSTFLRELGKNTLLI
jgi:hypothetical protein